MSLVVGSAVQANTGVKGRVCELLANEMARVQTGYYGMVVHKIEDLALLADNALPTLAELAKHHAAARNE